MAASKKDLIQFCRYYKGEKEPPKDINRWWGYEKHWVEMSATPKEDNCEYNTLCEYLDNYVSAGLAQYNSSDGVPVTLKALIYDRCKHFGGSVESFKQTYENDYKKRG